MTKVDRSVVEKLLRDAREALEEVRSVTSMSVDDFVRSRTARFSLRYSVVMLVEALADVAVIILEKDFDEAAESYREAFLKLAEKGVISAGVAERMAALAGLRNLIVHRYWAVDDMKVYRDARGSGIEAVEKFISEVLRYVEASDP